MRLVGDELVHEFKLTNGTSLTAKHSQVKFNKAHHRQPCMLIPCKHCSCSSIVQTTGLPAIKQEIHSAHPTCSAMQAQSCITVRTAAADVVLVVLNSLCGFAGSFGLWPATTWPLSADAGTTTGSARCSSASWHTTSSNLPGSSLRHASSSPAAAHGAGSAASHGKHGQRHRA